MRLRELRNQKQPQLMIIPMIDIIFFLLVFFMLSTLYMVEQKTIPVNLPQAAAAQTDLKRNVTVSITAEGKIVFEQEEIPLQLLQKRARIELAKEGELIVAIHSDKKVEYGKVVAVLDELKLAGVQRIAMAAERKGQ